MKSLLAAVNAKYIHSNLAVYSLKAAAGEYESEIDLAEYTINNQTEDIFRSIYQKKPDLLFFSCYIWNRSMVLELAENIHKVCPDTLIWAGGPEVSYDAGTFLRQNTQFTGVMRGEGEATFYHLLNHYLGKKESLEDISGITFQTAEGEIRSNPDAPMCRTLDEIPFVYQDLSIFEHKIIYYESSRGCPFSCSYCLSSIDKRVRMRSLELVKKELAWFLEQKVPQVKFVDRTFNCNHKHSLEIWQFIQEHDNGITNFHFEIAADLINEEELEVLSRMRPGLIQLEIGVQTVNEQALAAIHRTAKFEEIAKRVRRISGFQNMHQHLDLIAGLPYEDYESFQDSFDTVYRLKPQELQLGFLKVLCGSEMHQKAEEYGIVYRSKPPYEVLKTRWISCEELLRLKEVEEMLEVYYNSQQFRCTMEALEKYFERPYAMFAALADYYKEKELEGRQYSRMQRFELLRHFIREKAQQDLERSWNVAYLEELMTLDYYLRENGKSRPTWSADCGDWNSILIPFYQKEAEERLILPQYQEYNWKQMMRMTHAEYFHFDVLGDGSEKGTWLLFDYQKRNPLTADASVIEIDPVAEI